MNTKPRVFGGAVVRWRIAVATTVLVLASLGFTTLGALTGSGTLLWFGDHAWTLARFAGAILVGATLADGRPKPR